MSETTTVRVPLATKAILQEMARKDHVTLQSVLATLVEDARRRRILEETNAGYAALKADPEGWAELEAERRAWETAEGDGLEDL